MDGGAVQRELDDLAGTLGRSVSLDGVDGTLLGYSTQGTDVDPVRVEAILSRRVPGAVLAYQLSFGIESATGPVRVPANPGLGMTARTCVPVRADHRPVAYLWILDDGQSLDLPAVRGCAGRLAALIGHRPGRSEIDRLLADLFTDWPRPDLITDLARHEPRIRSQTLRFVAVPDDAPPVAGVLGTATANGRRLVLVAHTGPVSGILGPHPRAGYSRPFRAHPADPAAVSTLAARAIVAADCAAADPALPAVTGWDDLGVYRRLLLTTDPDSWPTPLPVPDDDRSAAMLLHTLETYLDHAGDAARTIAALAIHRTTFYYRLDRLTTLHGIRLDDGLTRTDLHLTLKSHRLEHASKTRAWTRTFLSRLR